MDVRQTSLDAYYAALYGGLIGDKQREILTVILQHHPELERPFPPGIGLTATETFTVLATRGLIHDSNSRARFTELRDKGMIYENGTKICHARGEPGKECIAWAATWQHYVKTPDKNETQAETIKRLEAELRESHAKLEACLESHRLVGQMEISFTDKP